MSGFCGLLYQVVWIRLAYASFGVITPVLSVVVSVFMFGLAVGSWAGGKWISVFRERLRLSAIVFYGLAELVIGAGAFIVPHLFLVGEKYLLGAGEMGSYVYLLYSSIIIGMSIFPWCVLMGFTFPFMMAFVKENDSSNTTSFSYLYFANVIGAMFGALVSALIMIELLGFKNTLFTAACLNLSIALLSFTIAGQSPYQQTTGSEGIAQMHTSAKREQVPSKEKVLICLVLFATGFVALSMEIVWVRAFTPVLKTKTYSFASLLSAYLFATWIGSHLYRRHLDRKKCISTQKLLLSTSIFAIVPVVMNDPRLGVGAISVLLSILPFCAVLGYLTPKLIDRYASGHPAEAGKTYALNMLGCIIGPLFASYILLPLCGAKMSMLVLAAPFLIFVLLWYKEELFYNGWSLILLVVAIVLLFRASFVNVGYEEIFASRENSIVLRDHTATVVATGQGFKRVLLVNGIGVSGFTPVGKMMAHLPMTFFKGKPESSLVIGFGIGTTYRSTLSWNVRATAVELVPSVIEVFGYYDDDAEILLNKANSKIIIDDGRRFLKRTKQRFDVITVDASPPVEAAGRSLLYSEEFYDLVKMRLNDGGIFSNWFGQGEFKILQAVARSLFNSFPYVKVYKFIRGSGFHFVASMSPISPMTIQEMIAKIPETAKDDITEWYPGYEVSEVIGAMIKEAPIQAILNENSEMKITDDKPFNEYYILRRLLDKLKGNTPAG